MLALSIVSAMVPAVSKASITPVSLRCEYLKNPSGIDIAHPRFSWTLEGPGRGECQTAYQILVASHRDNMEQNNGDKWDSGKVESDGSVNIAYEGEDSEERRSLLLEDTRLG